MNDLFDEEININPPLDLHQEINKIQLKIQSLKDQKYIIQQDITTKNKYLKTLKKQIKKHQ